jgi:hypothetical protein
MFEGEHNSNLGAMFFGNYACPSCAVILCHMAEEPDSTTPGVSSDENVPSDGKKMISRPFRVKLRGSVLVLVRLPNRRAIRAAFHQLSTTGGVIHLEKPLDEKLEVELIFHLDQTTIRSKAQMLFPMWATQGWMQPFRFVTLSAEEQEALEANLKSFVGETMKGASAGV